MRVPAYKIQAVTRMSGRLRDTLKRCDPPMPESLRLMAAQIVREGIIQQMLGESEIHPGLERMAKWGKVGQRQARRNVRILETWGLITPVAYKEGGFHRPRYYVDPEKIVRVAVMMGANPHPDLVAEIRSYRADIRADIRADMEGGHKAGHMSAVSYDRASQAARPASGSPSKPTGAA
jgi:hypothetical protein